MPFARRTESSGKQRRCSCPETVDTFLSGRHRFHHPAAPSCRLPRHMPVGNRHHMRHPDGGHRIQQPEKLHADGQLHPACLQHCGGFSPSAAGGAAVRSASAQRCAPLPHRGKTIDIQLDACQFRLARLRLNQHRHQFRGKTIQQASELFITVMAAAKPQPVPAGAHFFQ